MADPKKKEERLDLETRAWEMRRKGKSIPTIAATLDVAVSTVSRMLQRVAVRYHKELAASVEAQKAEQCAQIDHLIEEAIDAWERSKEDAETERTVSKRLGAKPEGEKKRTKSGAQQPDAEADEEVPGMYLGDDGEEVSSEEAAALVADQVRRALKLGDDTAVLTLVEETLTKEAKGQTGDARFLAEVRNLLADKRAIWGLDAPKPQGEAQQVVIKVLQGVDTEKV